MAHPAPDRPRLALEGVLRQRLEEGLRLSRETLTDMAAAWGAVTPSRLSALLGADAGGEEASLLELLFFPDLAFQGQLERHLAAQPAGKMHAALLIDALVEDPPWVRLWVPGYDQPAEGRMPGAVVSAFVGRLHLAWRPETRLAGALQGIGGQARGQAMPMSDWVRVRLRNADLPAGPVQLSFVLDFLARFGVERVDFPAALEFLVTFLADQPKTLDLHRALMDRRDWLRRQQERARQADAVAAGHNMETLAMAGFRAGYFDAQAAARQVEVIDAVNLTVFGCAPEPEPPAPSVALETGHGAEEAGRMLRVLA